MKELFKKIAIEAALKSGHFIKNSIGKIAKISYKGRDNIVTDVDKDAEGLIIKKILSAFPDHAILSEEVGSLHSPSPYKWIIDPLDGTTNYARAFPFFCVSIALEERGKLIVGVVYDPMREELYTADYGKGAYLNGKRIRVSKTAKLADSFLATGFSYGRKKRDYNVKYFRKFLMSSLAIRRAGSAALDLCYVANGRFDGFWEMDIHPWDSAAGSLIVKESKGAVTKFDGALYSCYDKNILATNSLIHHQMVHILRK